MLIIIDKDFNKTDKSTQNSLKKAFIKLEQRAQSYFNKNIRIDQIFDDDVLIHDIINDSCYVYKTKVNNMQIRVLYTVNDQNNIIIIAHHIKKNNMKYFSYFENCANNYN